MSLFINHTNNITPKLLSSFLDEDINNNFITIFNEYCIGEKSLVTKKFEFDNQNNTEFKDIINKAYEFFNSNGFNVDKNNGMVEFWKYTSTGEKVNVSLSIHEDDCGALPYKVETCIFYLQKSDSLKGGELLYIINKKNNFLGLFSYYSTEKKLLNVYDRMVVLLNGNLNHCPKSIIGKGTRKCIVVQFKSLDRN